MAAADDLPAGDVSPRKRDRFWRNAKRYAAVPLAVRTSDLPKRAASAVVMLAVAGGALWVGGWTWNVLVALVALGVLWEWARLVLKFTSGATARAAWMLGGLVYIGVAGAVLLWLNLEGVTKIALVILVVAVIAVDVGAYFAGRAIGGPKIAPRISPSKTWAGLIGGMTLSGLWLGLVAWFIGSAASAMATSPEAQLQGWQVLVAALVGAALAVVAQAGDFFESWMKRKAGVKDSSNLIPGHGGFFDRVDGLLAVCFVIGLTMLTNIVYTLASGGSLLPAPS